MKKFIAMGLCLAAVSTVSAQKNIVKDVERGLKADPSSYPSAVEKLKPAFSDPETATDAYTWFVAGKGAYDYYDQQSVYMQMGKQVDKKKLGPSVLEGYNFMMTALPLDTITDEKGKVKAKYSKDIFKQVVNHYNDLNNSALILWECEDYPTAVKAWEVYVSLPKDERFIKAGLKAPADTLLSEVMFNMGIGNSLAQNPQAALKCFKQAINMGNNKKISYDYAISVASQLGDTEEVANLAEAAYALYGKEDSNYIGLMINNLIEKKEYPKADALIDKYIAADPENAQLYYVKGVLCDSEEKSADAMDCYKKAMSLDPNNARVLLQYGYKLYQQAGDIDQNEGGNLTQAQYNELRANKIDPIFKEAAEYLEKAYQIDDSLNDCRTILRSIYYNLNDEENLKRVEAM